jgi:hypothetical protein
MNTWDNQKFLMGAEMKREERKTRGEKVLTFDCLNAICTGDRVSCRKGIALSLDGTLPLVLVLRGRTAAVCKNCLEINI